MLKTVDKLRIQTFVNVTGLDDYAEVNVAILEVA